MSTSLTKSPQYPNYANSTMGLDEVTLMWLSRRRRSNEFKELFSTRWNYFWKSYRGYSAPITDPAGWWQSSEVIPTIFKILETLLPRRVLGMFQNSEWYAVNARNARSEEYELMVRGLLDGTLEEMNIFAAMYEALKYADIMGHAWGKLIWREDYEQRQVLVPVDIPMGEAMGAHLTEEEFAQLSQLALDMLDQPSGLVGMRTQIVDEEVYNGPQFEWRPLDRVFPDPTGEYEWMVEDIATTMEKLDKVQDEVGVYDPKQLNMLRTSVTMRQPNTSDALGYARQGTSSAGGFDYMREPERTEGIPEMYVSPMRDGTGVRLQQCWGWVPPTVRKYHDTQWRLTVIAESRYKIRDEPSPTPDQRPPYFPIKSIVIPNRLYGESIINWIGPLADQQSRLANMRLDQVFLDVWGQYMARKDSVVSDNQLLIQPGGIVELDPRPGEGIKDCFAKLERQGAPAQSYQEDQYRQTQAQDAAFANELFQGATPSGGTTATEVERRLQQGNAPHMLQVMYNDHTVAKEILTRTWKWLQMRMPRSKVVRMVGDRYAMVNIADIQVPIDITVGGGLAGMSKDARVQMDQELLQMAANPSMAQFMKFDKILMRWMLDRGWKNPEALIWTQEELMMMQQQAMMAQGAQGAMGGDAGMGGGDMGALPPGGPQDAGGARPAEAGPNGQANQPGVPLMPSEAQQGALVGGQLAPGGLLAPQAP